MNKLKISTISYIGSIVDSNIDLQQFYNELDIRKINYKYKSNKLILIDVPTEDCVIAKQYNNENNGVIKQCKKYFRNQISIKIYLKNKNKIINLKIFRSTTNNNNTKINKIHISGVTDPDTNLTFFKKILNINNKIVLKQIISNYNYDFQFKINKQKLNEELDTINDTSITLSNQIALSSAGLSVIITSPKENTLYTIINNDVLTFTTDTIYDNFFKKNNDIFNMYNNTSILIFHSGKMISSSTNQNVSIKHLTKLIDLIHSKKILIEIS